MGEVKTTDAQGNDGLIQATVTITSAMLPHVRDLLTTLVGSRATACADALDGFQDPRAPSATVGRASTAEGVRACRAALLEAQGWLDQVGLEGEDGCEFTAPAELLEEWASELIESGAAMMGQACLYGDMTRDKTDRWYHEETGAGLALRDALTGQSERGVPA